MNKASVAYRITCSTCEWTWTQAEQEDMARAIVTDDAKIRVLRDALENIVRVCEEEHPLKFHVYCYAKEALRATP